MELDIERKIRSRIEAILINDARSSSALRMMASEEEPFDCDPFAEERNLYQRILNSYRTAINEVNALVEENVGFLSGLNRIAESIKTKEDFHEICASVSDCALQELGAEFCGIMFPARAGEPRDAFCFEAVREKQKFLFSHSHPTLLADTTFARAVEEYAKEHAGVVNVGDVYRESRFNSVDFPCIVRALICVPITTDDTRVGNTQVGLLILSHSMPNFFNQNHTRVLKILAALLTHLWILTDHDGAPGVVARPDVESETEADEAVLSIVLLTFETARGGRWQFADREAVASIRAPISAVLGEKESILPYEKTGYLVLLPGTAEAKLSERAAKMREAFGLWRAAQGARFQYLQLSLGFATCEDGEGLTRALEIAAQMMRLDPENADLSPVATG